MSSAFSCAHQSMSASRPWLRRFQALRLAARPSRASGNVPGEPDRRRRRVRAIAAERLGDPARAVRVVERELAEHARAEHGDVVPVRARRSRDRVEVEQRADVHVVEALGRGDEQPRAVRRREDERLRVRLGSATSRGELPKSKPGDRLEPALAGELRRALRSSRARAPRRSPRSRGRGCSRTRAPASSSRSRAGRRRRSRSAQASARPE